MLFLKWDGCWTLLQCQPGFLALNKWGTKSLPAAHSDLHYHWDHPLPCRQDNEPSHQRMKSKSCLIFLSFISGLSVLRLFDSATLSRYFLPSPPFQNPQIAEWSLTVNQAEHPESDHQILPWNSHFWPQSEALDGASAQMGPKYPTPPDLWALRLVILTWGHASSNTILTFSSSSAAKTSPWLWSSLPNSLHLNWFLLTFWSRVSKLTLF